MTFKRFLIACLMGVLAGVVCVLLSTSGGNEPMALKLMAAIFSGRVLIGFVIAVSAWKMNWALHGLLMGLIVSIPAGFYSMLGASPEYGKWMLLGMTIVMGMVYGFFIELVTSVIFKARQK